MSRGVNKVILVGNVGGDPEVRHLPNGNTVANLSLATSDVWKDKQSGEQQSRTEWHRVSLFGKVAEIAEKFVKKGSQLYIEGKLQTRKWQDQSGQDRYTTEVVVDMNGQMQLLGDKPDGGSSREGNTGGQQRQAPRNASAPQPARQAPTQDNLDDDIPF